ncbi:VanZ family protein [Salipaludibacillus aurantiacus]|uniref:VanZ like family protein n=1 Tax=Salipaludibacillus aurantiacus TaxID=1601833 RepID=A0A1H9VLD7_9BACI|nr:VanZ family protein [Salipaludibacillus aurantiacus]SES22157.1 VanZ like family protein [Salipaludibacillus aurantiacus]
MTFWKFTILNLLPVIIIMAVIYTASSQTADQQDISPLLDRVTDENVLRETAVSLKERVDFVADRAISFAASHPQFVLAGMAGAAALMVAVFFRLFQSTDSFAKKSIKSLVYTGLIFIFLAAVTAAVKSDAVIELLRSYVSLDHLRRILQWIDFTYAGTAVSLESHGVDGLLEFLLRKTAHFFLFALLGFFLFLSVYRLSGRPFLSFAASLIIVIVYAALDEYRQTFIPSRSGLVEDVILDTVGGIFGTAMAWLKKSFSKWLE